MDPHTIGATVYANMVQIKSPEIVFLAPTNQKVHLANSALPIPQSFKYSNVDMYLFVPMA